MASAFVSYFLNEKAKVTLDESERRESSSLNLRSLEMAELPERLSHLNPTFHSKLHRLFLQGNNLTNLPQEFGSLFPQLKVLAVDHNSLTDLPTTIAFMERLTKLNISHNDFSEKGFPTVIFSLRNLQSLWANGIGIKKIPSQISQLGKLRVLGLRHNRISKLPKEFWQLRSLIRVSIPGNRISSIPPDIITLATLVHLNMDDNRISQLPSILILSQLPELRYISLRRNSLFVAAELVQNIRTIPKLKWCQLDGNPIFSSQQFTGVIRPTMATRTTYVDPCEYNGAPESDISDISSEQSEFHRNPHSMLLEAYGMNVENRTPFCRTRVNGDDITKNSDQIVDFGESEIPARLMSASYLFNVASNESVEKEDEGFCLVFPESRLVQRGALLSDDSKICSGEDSDENTTKSKNALYMTKNDEDKMDMKHVSSLERALDKTRVPGNLFHRMNGGGISVVHLSKRVNARERMDGGISSASPPHSIISLDQQTYSGISYTARSGDQVQVESSKDTCSLDETDTEIKDETFPIEVTNHHINDCIFDENSILPEAENLVRSREAVALWLTSGQHTDNMINGNDPHEDFYDSYDERISSLWSNNGTDLSTTSTQSLFRNTLEFEDENAETDGARGPVFDRSIEFSPASSNYAELQVHEDGNFFELRADGMIMDLDAKDLEYSPRSSEIDDEDNISTMSESSDSLEWTLDARDLNTVLRNLI